MDIPENTYNKILQEIESDESPVGIDAKKAHIMIIYKIQEIEKRLQKIEERLDTSD